MTPYLICKFERQTLTNLVKESFKTEFPDIFHKKQIEYIHRYLKDLNCITVILEFDYIDKDYLEDYARYYVKGFNNSGYKTARLHFFSLEFDHSNIDRHLSYGLNKKELSALQNSYLGFMVVKPLPKTFIGRTCLALYPGIAKESNKKSLVREYSVDLFGIKLSVESIAFQEQDKVISACATTAIWSALHAISWKDIRDIPSRSEITTNAINHISESSNSFPNKELTNKQILRAVDSEKLKHQAEKLASVSQDYFFKKIKIHIDSGLPLILGVDVFDVRDTNKIKKRAGHAITILGYKDGVNRAIYIHDDRLGPYARATFEDASGYILNDTPIGQWGLILQEKEDNGDWSKPHEILIPDSLITVHYPKVRLPFNYSENTSYLIQLIYNSCLELVAKDKNTIIPYKLTYKVELKEISKIRQDFLNYKFIYKTDRNPSASIKFLRNNRVDFLAKSYARFQWVSSFYINGNDAFKILFDATDIPQGNAVSAIIYESKDNADVFFGVINEFIGKEPLTTIPSAFKSDEHFFNSFLKKINEGKDDYSHHLDVKFGKLRAPKSLKAGEFQGGVVKVNKTTIKLYGKSEDTLESICSELVDNDPDSYLIWAIADDGALLIGNEIGDNGHPSLTGFKPARIAGEIKRVNGVLSINSKSARYSRDYDNKPVLLKNAADKFKSIFQEKEFKMKTLKFNPKK
ncbi:hypothetical protein [Enterobacter asburiae]|uniref:hypothetical protein n=1 Tax=Enterobacter asburiae TaxID=61645 RepID=UPI0034CF24A1